jgi:flavin reductase (DIM6/NTAB) family NADH-FMN oxidoreductase RutF
MMQSVPESSELTPEMGPEDMRRIMRRWSTGVTLVTVDDGVNRHGMTVNSFTSVSLTPPLILVSLERGTRTHQMVLETKSFAVAILEAEQRDLAERFAGRIADTEDRFDQVPTFSSPLGHPLPEGCLAYVDAKVEIATEAGTHTVFIARASSGAAIREGIPLLYYNRSYRRLIE